MLRGESGRILRELFEFGDLTEGEVMVPRVMLTGIEVGTEPDALRVMVQANPHTRYPTFACSAGPRRQATASPGRVCGLT